MVKGLILQKLRLGHYNDARRHCGGSYAVYIEALEEYMSEIRHKKMDVYMYNQIKESLTHELCTAFMLGKDACESVKCKPNVLRGLMDIRTNSVVFMDSNLNYNRHRDAVFEGIYGLHCKDILRNTKYSYNSKDFLVFSEEKGVFRVSVDQYSKDVCYMTGVLADIDGNFSKKSKKMDLNVVLNTYML